MLRLSRHPSTLAHVALDIDAEARELASGELTFRYRVTGDVRAVRVPAPAPARRTDGLWRHTCFEAFVRLAGARYLELNFSPSAEWAAYAFARYRERVEPPALEAPVIRYTSGDDWLELAATLRLETPFAARDSALGLAAVIEDSNGRSSYWALEHPRATPDFHDAAGWTGRLATTPDEKRA